MRWFERQRMNFIEERLKVYGTINRQDLIEQFDISTPQASKDFQLFLKLYPDRMAYNFRKKHYEISEGVRPSHKWDADGERCVKCGDKDWMNDPVCSESKLKERPQEGMPEEIWAAPLEITRLTHNRVSGLWLCKKAKSYDTKYTRVHGWRDIETAPKDGTSVDIWCGFRMTRHFYCVYHEETDTWLDNIGGKVRKPTHWMPSPTPPEKIDE